MRFHFNNPESLTCAEATWSIFPPWRRRRLFVCGSGRPSLSQVREGVGIPVASHCSSRTLLTTTDTSAGTPVPSMCGGSSKVKFLYSVMNQKLKLENDIYNLSALTHNFEVEVTTCLTSSVVSHAGVATCVTDLGLSNMQGGIQVKESDVVVRD